MGDDTTPNDELSTNLFSDIAPILALFGEPFARQFMSESMGWLDHFIFALAPLGILTAVVSAIRVGGPGWLRAIVGRARENVTTVELELMSSTSEEVCELWNGTGVVRTAGKPEVKEIVYLEHLKDGDSCGLYTVETALAAIQERNRSGRTSSFSSGDEAEGEKKAVEIISQAELSGQQEELMFHFKECEDPFMKVIRKLRPWKRDQTDIEILERTNELMENQEGAPNISLNLHGGTNPSEQWFATIFGFFLQFGVLVFSGFTAYHPRFRTRLTVEGNVVANFAFPLMATGTTMMTVGLILCSAVVDHGSHEGELSFLDPKSRTEIKAARILWLQRKHEVGDQRFSTYAMFARNKQRDEMLSRILLSRRAKPSVSDSAFLKGFPTLRKLLQNRDQLDATVGALCSLIGFLLQLIAIRQLHWSTSIAHLTALILMSLIRAWLRRGLIITPSAAQVPDEHELDWLALRIGGSGVDDEEHEVNQEHPLDTTSKQSEQPGCKWWLTEGESDDVDNGTANKQTELWIDSGLIDECIPSRAPGPISRTIKIRQRLGSLTQWKGPASDISVTLAKSISVVMNTLGLCTDDRGAPVVSFQWNLRACMSSRDLGRFSDAQVTVEKIGMVAKKTNAGWEVDATEIEAVLSLWLCHIVQQSNDGRECATEKKKDSRDWLQHSNSTKRKAVHLIGPKTLQTVQDINRWTDGWGQRVEFWDDSRLTSHASSNNGSSDVFMLGAAAAPLAAQTTQAARKETAQNASNQGEFDNRCSEYMVITSEAEQDLLVLMAQHIFSAFLRDFVVAIDPGQLAMAASPRNADQVTVSDANTFSILKLDCAPLNDISQKVASLGLGSYHETKLFLVSALNRERKLPFKPVIEVVQRLVWKNEVAGEWQDVIPVYLRLFKGKFGLCHEASEDYRTLIVIAVGLLDALECYIASSQCRVAFRRHPRASRGFVMDTSQLTTCKLKLIRIIFSLARRAPFFTLPMLRDCYRFQNRDSYDVAFKVLMEASENNTDYQRMLAQALPTFGSPQDRRYMIFDPTHWTALHYAAVHQNTGNGRRSQGDDGPRLPLTESTRIQIRKYREYAGPILMRHGRRMIDQPDAFGMSPFYCGLAYRPSEEAIAFFLENGASLRIKDRRGRTGLHYLSSRDSSTFSTHNFLMELLVKETFQDHVDYLMRTAYLHASFEGAVESVRTFVNRKCELECRDRLGWTSLHLSLLKFDNPVLAQFLIDAGLSVEVETTEECQHPLHICAALNRVKVAGILLKSGADVNAANYKGTTALHYASTPEIAKLLIDAGANVNARNEDGETPLHFAQYHFTHSLEISKLLIDSGATVDNSTWMSKGLDSPLQLLARLRKTSDINILECEPTLGGADLIIGGFKRCELLGQSDECLCEDCLEKRPQSPSFTGIEALSLSPHKTPVEHTPISPISPLSFSFTGKSTKGSENRMSIGGLRSRETEAFTSGKYKRRDQRACIVLQESVVRGLAFDRGTTSLEKIPRDSQDTRRAHLAGMLIEAGADVNGTSTRWGPLHYASENHDVSLMKVLCEHGAKVDAILHIPIIQQKKAYLMTPLAIAVASCAAITSRVDFAMQMEYTFARHIFQECDLNSLATVQLLLDLGASPNGLYPSLTPLHAAIAFSKKGRLSEQTRQMLRILLDKGLDINALVPHFTLPNEQNPRQIILTALHLAVELDNMAFIKFLLENGANPNATCNGVVGDISSAEDYTPLHVAIMLPSIQRLAYPNQTVGAELTVDEAWIFERPGRRGCIDPASSGVRPSRNFNTDTIPIVDALLAHGAEVEAKCSTGQSTLHIAVMKALAATDEPRHATFEASQSQQAVPFPVSFDYCQLIRTLIDHGADVNSRDAKGRSTLHAVVTKTTDLIAVPLHHGYVQVEWQAFDELTGKVLEALLHDPKTVDIDATDNAGKTPLYYARLNGLGSCEQLLLRHGAMDGPESQPLDVKTDLEDHTTVLVGYCSKD